MKNGLMVKGARYLKGPDRIDQPKWNSVNLFCPSATPVPGNDDIAVNDGAFRINSASSRDRASALFSSSHLNRVYCGEKKRI